MPVFGIGSQQNADSLSSAIHVFIPVIAFIILFIFYSISIVFVNGLEDLSTRFFKVYTPN